MNDRPTKSLQLTCGSRAVSFQWIAPLRLPQAAEFSRVGQRNFNPVKYTIEQVEGKREGFSEYRYRILGDGQLVAYYWHDYRGDEHGIEFVGGGTELWPVGRMIDFLKGGGPEPLELSARAVAYLHAKTKDENP